MRQDLTIKTASLSGTSELTVIAPIRRGLVPALDSVTYKSRVKRVLRTLHLGRSGAHEFELARVLSDAVERVGRIHSVSIAVLEPEDQVKLAVTFDGAWEAYVRVIWQKVTRLLDLIFCHTEGYVLGWEHSYEDWGRWLRSRQVETSFLYATPGLTVDDTRHLRMHERLDRRLCDAAGDLAVTRLRTPSAEDIASQGIFGDGTVAGLDPSNAGCSQGLLIVEAGVPTFRHGMRSLAGLHRLADLFPPGTADGAVLQRAAQELLPEFMKMLRDGNTYQTGVGRAVARFDEALRWFMPVQPTPVPRQPPPLPAVQPVPAAVQGGIVEGYDHANHGVLLLLAFDGPAAVDALLAALQPTSAAQGRTLPPGTVTTNLAFTVEGLRAAGLSEAQIAAFPEEFVQGMERRAGLLGDVRINHPRRWRRPVLNWAQGVDAEDEGENADSIALTRGKRPKVVAAPDRPRVDLAAVHAVLQLRLVDSPDAPTPRMAARRRLMAALRGWLATDPSRPRQLRPGVQPLSLQWMHRLIDRQGTREHFGFLDGNGQPVFNQADNGRRYDNQVHLGEVLCGHANRADAEDDALTASSGIKPLLRNGSFLVLRKLRQDVEALQTAVAGAVKASQAQVTGGLDAATVKAKMMGRWPLGHREAGRPLVGAASSQDNDFHYDDDPQGAQCPFHAHIRRAHPRPTQIEAGSRPPRIVRRGMSYGRPVRRSNPDSLQEERGLVFMAYNASIGEQFEVVQRWLAGGNSSGSHSGLSDPLLGLAEPGRRRHFRFEHDGHTLRLPLDGSDALHAEPRPLVRLEWGAYLFAPSLDALRQLRLIAQAAAAAAAARRPAVPWDAALGERHIAALQDLARTQGDAAAVQAWKAALEDPEAAADFTTASIWAAIRQHHGGVLRTPYGVLAGSCELVQQLLLNPGGQLTANGYLERMQASFGPIFLGRDAGTDGLYEAESKACVKAIMGLPVHETYRLAYEDTRQALEQLMFVAVKEAGEDAASRWDLTIEARELIDPLLGRFCERWFGLRGEPGDAFRFGGFRWDWQPLDPPLYPGHFMAPSRYFFQPHPGGTVQDKGRAHGVALNRAMAQQIADPDRRAAMLKTRVAGQVLKDKRCASDPDFALRTLVGAIMGFVPTIDGNLKRILNEWLREGTLWSLRARGAAPARDFDQAFGRLRGAFTTAMQLRAAPELLWRRVRTPHTLGAQPGHAVRLEAGDVVVAGLISATQQALENGSHDVYDAFGGNRFASGQPHPTHACPGAPAAMAMMLGFLNALVESPLPLRPGPGPLTLSLDGEVPGPVHQHALQVLKGFREAVFGPADGPTDGPPPAPPRAEYARPLLVIGDSWLTVWWQASLIAPLRARGYDAIYRHSSLGRRLQEMAEPEQLNPVLRRLIDPRTQPPVAVLLGGGGNDNTYPSGLPTQTPLFQMLKPGATTLATALDEAIVHAAIDVQLRGHYQRLIGAIRATRPDLPIFIHGYDHPIPDGRAEVPESPWLAPVFKVRGIQAPDLPRQVMRVLIGRLNRMVADLAASYPRGVHHVDLQGTLAAHAPKGPQGPDHTAVWRNELHPTATGFGHLADVIAARLDALVGSRAGAQGGG